MFVLKKACSILFRLFVSTTVACGYRHSFLLLSGPQPSVDFYASALQARALSVLPPPNREQLMNDLQKHLGKGVAPPISEIAEGISNRQLTGARALASDFAESVLHAPSIPVFRRSWQLMLLCFKVFLHVSWRWSEHDLGEYERG